MTPKELLDAGHLSAAIAQLTEEVKANPELMDNDNPEWSEEDVKTPCRFPPCLNRYKPRYEA